MSIRHFLRLESAGGLVLMAAAAAALVLANLPGGPALDRFLSLPLTLGSGAWALEKPLLLWINDGLMAVFFLLVGLEIKREIVEGELSSPSRALLPIFAAAGGMLAPAAVYLAVAGGDPATVRGWAIPAATDIAFALGILALLGSKAPVALKVFLTAVAIIDDLGAIAIIALFYTDELAVGALAAAGGLGLALVALNRAGVSRLWPYLLVGVTLWAAVLKSGVHATLAGVIVALTVPMRRRDRPTESMLVKLEHGLHPWVAFGVLPVFALANAGVPLLGLSPADLLSPISVGVALGLLVGKPVGILLFSWIPLRAGWTSLPSGVGFRHLAGASLLAGVGFTMSLFIGGLAFSSPAQVDAVKIGVLAGSALAAIGGVLALVGGPSARRRADALLSAGAERVGGESPAAVR